MFPLDVSLHDENSDGDIGSPGSLHRLLRGMAIQRAQKRDEFISAELTNHLFQSGCKFCHLKLSKREHNFYKFFSISIWSGFGRN